MVLSLLKISGKGYLEEAARAVRWINTKRNSHGGFVSTQVSSSSQVSPGQLRSDQVKFGHRGTTPAVVFFIKLFTPSL